MWGKDLTSAVGPSKKNLPCEDSFFWARALARQTLAVEQWPLHLLGESSPAGLGAELGASCPAHVSCGCRARGVAHPQVLAMHQGVQCVDRQPCSRSSGDFLSAGAMTQGNAG